MKPWRAVIRRNRSECELFYRGEKLEGIAGFGVRAGVNTQPVLQIAVDGRTVEVDWAVDDESKEGGDESGS